MSLYDTRSVYLKYLFLLLAISFLLQIGLILTLDFRSVEGPGANDRSEYNMYRKRIAEGENYFDFGNRPPVYPLFTGTLYRISPDVKLVRVVQVMLFIGLCTIFYFVVSNFFEARSALISTGLLAFYPGLIYFNIELFSDSIFTLLSTLGFLSGMMLLKTMVGENNPTKGAGHVWWVGWALLAAFFISMGYMTRSAAVFSFLALLAVLVYERPKKWLLVIFSISFSFTIIALPMFINTYKARGYFGSPEHNFWWALYLGNNPSDRVIFVWQGGKGTEILKISASKCRDPERTYRAYQDCTGVLRETVLNEITSRPLLAFLRIFGKAFDFWTLERSLPGDLLDGDYGKVPFWSFLAVAGLNNILYLIVLVSGVVGLIRARHNRPLVLYAALMLLFTTFGIALVTWGHPRYHIPLIPVLAVFSGPGLLFMLEKQKKLFQGLKANEAVKH